MADGQAPSEQRITSRDGTSLYVSSSGSGPPLLLVHGTAGDSRRWQALRALLEPQLTVHALDRRGRGQSGDGSDYDIQREFEDVAAVVDAIAEQSGGPLGVYGHSLGALCALAATGLTHNIGRLALYELPVTSAADRSLPLAEMVAAGQRDAALELFMLEEAGLSDTELSVLRARPGWWQMRLEMLETIVREHEADLSRAWPLARLDGGPPTTLLVGTASPDAFRAELIRLARTHGWRLAMLEGQGHVADALAPHLVADVLLDFFLEDAD
jgi:pimeloyl-ACP methyl ester carboxylesterase